MLDIHVRGKSSLCSQVDQFVANKNILKDQLLLSLPEQFGDNLCIFQQKEEKVVTKRLEDHQINYLDPNATKNLVTLLKKQKNKKTGEQAEPQKL